MTSKKKAEVPTLIEDLRSETVKKRLAAVCDLKEISLALGPIKVRGQMLKFLEEFLDDQEAIVMELFNQLEDFSSCLGGNEYQKCLLPLLILFCKTDERAIAYRSSLLIQRILNTNQDHIMETIKKISSTQMIIAKECGLQLIAKFLPKNQGLEKMAIQMMTSLVKSEKHQDKIVCAKYISDIIKSIKSKQQIAKIFDIIYNDGDQLSKIYGIKGLVEYYDVNPSFCLTKFKNISILNSWRLNLKICQMVQQIFTKCTKSHFKLIFQPMFIKFMISNEPELRAASCQSIFYVGQSMTDQQQKFKLMPSIKRMAQDGVQYVKIQLSKHIIKLCEVSTIQLAIQSIFPIIFNFIKDQNSEISIGIIKSYDYLISKMNKEVFQEKIFKPLLQQLATDNWRVKCQIIEILRTFIYKQIHLNEGVLKVIFGLTDDKIDAVRLKANELIIQIINKNRKEWVEKNVIPRIICGQQNIGYIKKQNFLDIIQKTVSNISEKALKESYQANILHCLSDKVTNVKLKSLQIMKNNPKLYSLVPEKLLDKLKEDKDSEVRQFTKKLRA